MAEGRRSTAESRDFEYTTADVCECGLSLGAAVIRLFLPIVIGIVSSSAEQLPPMEANQNHMEAGVVRVAALFLTSAAGIVVCARAVRHT